MKFIFFLLSVTCLYNLSNAEEVRLTDLEPSDAQQVIESQDQSLKYAPKVDSNVPAVRYLGNEPHNVLEDIYLAKQYHGQDGLGGYLYGYSVPDIAKNEKKKAGGDLRGAYNYINGQGQEIKVEYWDDGNGFHQIDNVPKILPKQIDDSPDVKAAKEQFLRRWQEEAERNQHPVQNPYNNEGQYASGPLSIQGQQAGQQQFAAQSNYPHQPTSNHQNTQYNQQPGQNQPQALSTQYQSQSSSQYQPQGTQQSSSGGYQQVGGQYQPQGSQHSSQSYQPTGGQYQPQGTQQSSGAYQPIGGQYQAQGSQQTSGSYQPTGGQYQPQGTHQNSGTYQAGGGQYQPQGSQQGAGTYQPTGGQYQHTGYNPQQKSYPSAQNQIDYSGQGSETKDIYSRPEGGIKSNDEEEESTGPPKGFFYSFDYPVGIIVQKQGKADLKQTYDSNKSNYEAQLRAGRSSDGSSAQGYQLH